MSVIFREATREDIGAVVALLADDPLGAARETGDFAPYLVAFDAIRSERGNTLIVGESGGRIVATCQLTFIAGLSLRAARRAQVESVRVAVDRRGLGIGRAMMGEVERRARAAGCSLIQLTMNVSRRESAAFYARLGFVPSHVGFKRELDNLS